MKRNLSWSTEEITFASATTTAVHQENIAVVRRASIHVLKGNAKTVQMVMSAHWIKASDSIMLVAAPLMMIVIRRVKTQSAIPRRVNVRTLAMTRRVTLQAKLNLKALEIHVSQFPPLAEIARDTSVVVKLVPTVAAFHPCNALPTLTLVRKSLVTIPFALLEATAKWRKARQHA